MEKYSVGERVNIEACYASMILKEGINKKLAKLRGKVFQEIVPAFSSIDCKIKSEKAVNVFSSLVGDMSQGYACQLFARLKAGDGVFVSVKKDFSEDLAETVLRKAMDAYSNPDNFEFDHVLQYYLNAYPINSSMEFFVNPDERTEKWFFEMAAKCWLGGFFIRDELYKLSNPAIRRFEFKVIDGGKE